jgi:tetratricopeptide (TPR) repeat protein
MNFLNIIIIGASLVALIVVIVIITKSLKNVDEKIVEELQSEKSGDKKGVLFKIKSGFISFFEWIIKTVKENIQKLHLWIIKVKRKNKSDIIKAKEELIIKEDEELEEEELEEEWLKEKELKGKEKEDMVVPEEIDQDEKNEEIKTIDFFSKGKELPIDSLATEKERGGNIEKKGFMKSLFKGKKQAKKILDIKTTTVEKWALDGSVGESVDNKEGEIETREAKGVGEEIKIAEVGRKFKKDQSEAEVKQEEGQKEMISDIKDADEFIGVDRKILEKKILQKIDKNPKELSNYRELGDLYIKMEKLDDALEVFEYILSVKPRDLVALRKKRKIKLLKRITK